MNAHWKITYKLIIFLTQFSIPTLKPTLSGKIYEKNRMKTMDYRSPFIPFYPDNDDDKKKKWTKMVSPIVINSILNARIESKNMKEREKFCEWINRQNTFVNFEKEKNPCEENVYVATKLNTLHFFYSGLLFSFFLLALTQFFCIRKQNMKNSPNDKRAYISTEFIHFLQFSFNFTSADCVNERVRMNAMAITTTTITRK